jgi:tetratricopeptide (TPR) repeat protein
MPAARPDRKLFALLCVVLALGTAALYWPITGHPFILYDDEQYITANPHVTTGLSWANFLWAFQNGEAANWHPLTWLSHQLDCQLFAQNAGWHHLVNLLFHVANSLLVLVFLRNVTGALWGSAIVAALFAWHPLHVESVAWASERKDVLSTFFWLLTLMAYARYAELSKVQSPKSKVYYALALLLFAGGLMSKPMVVTLPCVLLLLDFWPLERIAGCKLQVAGSNKPTCNLQPSTFNLLLEKLPFFLLAAAGSAVTYLVQTGGGAVWATPWSERLANAVIAYARYVGKLFFPGDLAIVYSHPHHWPVFTALGAAGLLLVWTWLALRGWRQHPWLAVGWLWFLGTLVPTIGIVQVGAQSMADRYTYIPSIGFFIAVVWGLAESPRLQEKRFLPLITLGVLAGCVMLTTFQIQYWQDNIRLFRRALEVSPDNYIAANCLGKAYEKTGDAAHALVCYQLAVATEPRFPQSQFNYAIALMGAGQPQAAFKHLEVAAALEPRNPDIQFDLGIYFSQHDNWTNAAACFRRALAVRPGFPPAQMQLNRLLAAHPDVK